MVERVSIDRLRELLAYDPTTGSLTWMARPSKKIRVGDEAGAPGANGRRYVGVDGQRILAHRIAWALTYGEWPDGNVAPANGDYLDLALSNLKQETASETARKGGLRRTNYSGAKGVSWDKSRGKWLAVITRDYKLHHLGRFDTKEAAIAAYETAATEIGLSEAREKEAKRAETHEESRSHGRKRARWLRLRKAHVTMGWTSFEHFLSTVSEPPSDIHKLGPVDPAKIIGPDNYEWCEPQRSEFDQTTKEGRAAYNRQYREQNVTALRERDLIKMFGITLADYQRMLAAQDCACAICKKPETAKRDGQTKWLAVDHDHSLGRGAHSVRGLLCSACNQALGHMKDDPSRLRAAADYLEAYARPGNVVPIKKDTA